MEKLLKVSEQSWMLAKRRERVLSQLAKEEECSQQTIQWARSTLGLSRAMIFRLLARYRDDRRLSSLLPQTRGRKLGRRLLSPKQEKIVSQQIHKFYLRRERPSVAALHREIATDCAKGRIPIPSYGSLVRRLGAFDQRIVVRKREGAQAARQKFQPLQTAPDVAEPLALVQIDHTLADVMVVDELERKPIGRPWVTLSIDVATRAVLGFHLSLAAPSSTSVALVVRMSVLPKDALLKNVDGELQWPMYGLPDRIHVDNAREFRSKALQRGCEEYGIELQRRPVRQPHFGGHIERLIGTMMGEVHLLPGTTFSSVRDRGNYDSAKQAFMTLSELEAWFILQVCGIYHRTRHSSIKMTPMEAWRKSMGRRPNRIRLPQNVQQFHIDFLPFKSRKVRRDGVRLFNIFYWSDALGTLLGRGPKSMPIHYDPRNLSVVYVKDESGQYLEVPYRTRSHPAITLDEYLWVTRKRAGGKFPLQGEESIFQAIEARRRLIEQARAKTRKARREAQKHAYAVESSTKGRTAKQPLKSDEPEEVLGKVEPYPVEIWYGRKS